MKAPPQSTKKNVKADEILRQKDPGFMAELDALDHLAKDWFSLLAKALLKAAADDEEMGGR